MALKLEFLGVGAGFSVGLGNNNAIIYDDTPENGYWCIDLGETSRVKLVELGLADKCKGVIVTHLHGDHIYGLEMMGFWWRFVKHKRLRVMLGSVKMLNALTQILSGTMREIQDDRGTPIEASILEFFAPMVYHAGDFMRLKFPSGDLDVSFISTAHVPEKESYSVVLKHNGKQHLFTADTRVPHTDLQWDTVWHDCQLYDGKAGGVHAYIGDIERFVRGASEWEINPNPKTWLMHYNRQPTEKEIESAEKWCQGFVKPGQVFDL